ncbi:PatU [Tolypothrix sp. PCC 7910]|uniref:PatU n=1 Tax=Tolypothrix sp. PCC 7910 TaxID=2099387 RepID=UPI0014279C36|nr:PatU [Tolypothrix sp. PCC 7910]QIR37353.1 PatU [Tolypothrix sp. PCC 7910]
MNSDSESFHHQLLSLVLADNVTTTEFSSVDCQEINGVENPLKQTAGFEGGKQELGGTPQTFQLGEIPTVQERFQAVIKHRLQLQIQNRPPLFPWETQLVDYPDYADEPSVAFVPAWGWIAQQSKLNLPIALPESIFRQLLEKCQLLLTSSLPLGAKLVQAVEELFPSHNPQTLNDIAGLVLRSGTSRSIDALEAMPNLQSDYSDLREPQQMALSLLTVKQLLDTLTIPISLTHPVVEREWLTSAGILKLKIEYQSQRGKLRVQGELPTRGIFQLQGDATQAVAQSSNTGSLVVELPCQQINQTYTLEVDFPEIDQQPLVFVINPT